MRKSLLILAWFIVTAGGVGFSQQTTTTGTFVDPDGTAWNAGTYSIQYVNATPGKPYNTSTGAFITTLYSGSLNSSGALSLTLDDVKYISPANGTWAFTICPNVSGGASNCSIVDIPVTGATENVSSLVNAALRAPRPGGGVGAYGYADVEFQAIPGNTYVVSPALTVQRCYAGSWAACGAGGGGGTPAGVNGNPQINASSSFGAAANVIYQQSGDTIASIETACSSPCTYVVTSPQTITLAASHAMNSNVWLRFEANGSWTVNGSTYVLSNVQVAPGTTDTGHFPTGTGNVTLSTLNMVVPAPWFGAACNGAGNDLTAIQNAINATTNGQVFLPGDCYIAGTVNASKNNVGILGIPAGRGGYVSGLTETVAGDDAIDVHGTSSTYVTLSRFQDFFVSSSVAQTGTAAGLSASFTGGITVQNVVVTDFFYGFSIHSSPSYGGGGFVNDVAGWTGLSSGMTNPVCFYLPSTDGNAENSITLQSDSCSAPSSGGPTQPVWIEAYGTAVNDINITGGGTAFTNGVEVVYTGSGSGANCSDIHVINETVDNFLAYADYVSGCTAAQTGSVEISGGWAVSGTATSSTAAVYILNSSGVSVNHVQIGAHANYVTQAANGVEVSGGSGNSIVGNTFLNQGQPYNLTGTTSGNTISSNTFINNSGQNLGGGQVGSSATYNTVANNTWSVTSGTVSTGFYFGGNNNTYVGNTCTTGVTTCILDNGTGNGLSAPIKLTTAGTTANAFQATGANNFTGWNNATPSSAYSLGFTLPGGTAGTNFIIGCYGGAAWQNCLTFNTSTLAATFGGAVTAPSYATATNCSSAAAPAVCGSATSGSVVVAAAGTTVVVNTTAVTANSQIQLTFDSSLGTRLSVTCNTSIEQPTVSARTAGTSFTITVPTTVSTNPDCVSYTIVN